jgi:hypothetical protein
MQYRCHGGAFHGVSKLAGIAVCTKAAAMRALCVMGDQESRL